MTKDNKSELLLLDDVEDLGRSGDIVQVKKGYARNFLLPRRKAVFADANAKRIQAKLQEDRKAKAAEDLKESNELKVKIEKLSLRVDVKVDPEGHMYGSIAPVDIVQLLEKESVVIERRSVILAKALKQTGSHKINIKLKEGVEASLKLDIIPEGTSAEDLAKITAPVEEEQNNANSSNNGENPTES